MNSIVASSYPDYGEMLSKAILVDACRYLKTEHGRTISEGPRRILTAALLCVGTDDTVDLKQRNIAARLGLGKE